MKALRKILNTVLNVLAGGSFIAMTLLTCWQVFTRYILSNPSSWSEELVGYLFAWMSLFGACLVTGERGHMNIPLLFERVKPGVQKILGIFAEVIACIFAIVILVYGGVQISSLAMGQMTSSLGVPIGVFYVVMPVCGVLIAIYTIINIIEIANGSMSVIVADEGAQAIEKVEREAKEALE
jgi:TRAP-type C4-dicarboxylate transport system permease small subunit